MSSNEITIYQYSPKYNPVEFVSYVGGLVSLYLGFTFLAIFDYFKAIVEFILKQLKSKSLELDKKEEKRSLSAYSREDIIPWYMNFDADNNRKQVVRSFAEPVPYEYKKNCMCDRLGNRIPLEFMWVKNTPLDTSAVKRNLQHYY